MKKSRGNDAIPGGDKAVLKLADDTPILLDTATTEQIASRGNIQIVKSQNGQLRFVVFRANNDTSTATGLNTVTTPHGGQYQVTLPDGTRVWLNAATLFTFPTDFTGDKRQVQLVHCQDSF